MAKSVHNDVLDEALLFVENNADKMVVCSQEPTTFTEANSTYALADVSMTSGDYTIADGDTSGRKVTVAQKSGVTVDSTGTGNHVALLDTNNSKLLYVTTSTSQSLTSGNTMTFEAWDIELRDPS
jgi:hypothetical protein